MNSESAFISFCPGVYFALAAKFLAAAKDLYAESFLSTPQRAERAASSHYLAGNHTATVRKLNQSRGGLKTRREDLHDKSPPARKRALAPAVSALHAEWRMS